MGQLYGQIPDGLSLLTRLTSIALSRNELSGTIPPGISALKALS